MDDLAFLLGGDMPTGESSDTGHRNIWVVAERQGDGLSRVTRQVLGKARELGDRLGVRVEAVLLGHEVEPLAQQLIALGADTVFVADDALLSDYSGDLWVKVLDELVTEKKPEILLFGFSAVGKEVAPRLAQRLKTGLVADCVNLDIDESERLLIGTRVSFGGRSYATVTCPKARPQMATVHPNAFNEAYADSYRTGDVERLSVSLSDGDRKLKLVGTSPAPTSVPLERAKVLVVGGKGLGGAEGAALLQQLADALGGQVAGTRSAAENGWVAADKEVSGRGATVAPDLYIGVGVSGSMDHVDAMRQSRTIVAINTKPDAALMEMADYAVVGDYREVIPAFLATLQAAKAKKVGAGAR
jgi:electron transfer flavoprotein alpha subunit